MPAGTIAYGSRGDLVRAYEQRLADLRFDPGPIDGVFDLDTRYAVEAVQKIFDLPRTGTIGEAERFVISAFQYPAPLQKWRPDPVDTVVIMRGCQSWYTTMYWRSRLTSVRFASTGACRGAGYWKALMTQHSPSSRRVIWLRARKWSTSSSTCAPPQSPTRRSSV